MIPPLAHFVWYGDDLPWVYALAVKSAARRGAFARVVLHHRDDLSRCPAWPELLRLNNFEPRRLDEQNLFREAGSSGLYEICRELQSYTARSNLIRAALLYRDGGVYLDLDTVTVRSLTQLREASSAFLGLERIVFPYWVSRSKNPWVQSVGGIRSAIRFLCRLLPRGHLWFRRLEPWYHLAVNGAVFGAAPGHPFVAGWLEAMAQVPPERRHKPHALGTHVLQETWAHYAGGDVRVYEPEYFFPLGPEISEHWFRSDPNPSLDKVITPRTRVVHWYASVRTKARIQHINAGYVRTHAPHQLFSRLALPFLDADDEGLCRQER